MTISTFFMISPLSFSVGPLPTVGSVFHGPQDITARLGREGAGGGFGLGKWAQGRMGPGAQAGPTYCVTVLLYRRVLSTCRVARW